MRKLSFISCFVVLFTALLFNNGCCIASRQICFDKEITGHVLPATGTYRCYTNGMVRTVGNYTYPKDPIYKYCSYNLGPWYGSDIYPATRMTLNALSGWTYSPACSGDYMNNIITLPLYPLVVCELPIQFVLDTVLIPFDLLNAPTVPEGYNFAH